MILKGPNVPLESGNTSIGSVILDTLKENPEFVGQIIGGSGKSFTYGRLAEESIRCALWLKKQKIGPGDFILVYSQSDNIASWASYLSVFYIGAIANGWVHTISSDITRHHINLTKPKIIFAPEDVAQKIINMLKEENIDTKIIVFHDVPGFESFNDIINQQSAEEVAQFECSFVNSTDDSVIFTSSGSTGPPKLIQYSYEGLHQSVVLYQNELRKEKMGLVTLWKLTLYSMVGVLDMLICILSMSPLVIINNDSTEEEIWATVEKYKVQAIYLHAVAFNNLAKSNKITEYNLTSLISIRTSGSKVRAEAVMIVSRLLPNCQVIVAYGMNEFSGLAFMTNQHNKNRDYCGRLCSNVQMKIVDVFTGEILGPHKPGEIYLKRPFMMKGYFRNPESTADAIDSEGWLHSGDFGYYDENEEIYLIDRIKNMIKYRNEFVSATEIETDLLKHPEVKDVTVIGVPHYLDNEHPLAFVIKTKDSKVSEQELLKLSVNFGESKILPVGVIFIEEIPILVSGKIDKQKLKEIAKSYIDKKSFS